MTFDLVVVDPCDIVSITEEYEPFKSGFFVLDGLGVTKSEFLFENGWLLAYGEYGE